ncbi:hypothetical protein Tco_0765361 [Tanacetum coccineum]
MANMDFCDKHNMVAFLQKPTGSEEFHQIVDFLTDSHIMYALTANPTIYVFSIEQFWQTATVETVNDREQQITVIVDGQTIAITEASVRRHLQLADADGISSLPNTEIFEQLTLMGYVSNDDKLTFQKGKFSPQWRFLIHTILHCLSPKKTSWEQFSSNIATAIICLATNRTFKFSKLIFDGMVKNVDSKTKFLMYPRFIQMLLNKKKRLLKQHKKTYVAPSLTQKLFSNMKRGFSGEHIPLFDSMLIHDQPGQGEGPTLTVESQHTPIASPTTSQPTTSQPMSSQEQPSQVPTTKPIITTSSPPLYETTIPHTTSSMPHDSPLSGGDTPGSDEGSKKLNELTELCTKLSDKVTSLEEDLKQTKKVYGKALTKLVKKVKYMDDNIKSTLGRMTETEYEDVDVETEYEEVEYELDQTDTFQETTPTKVSQAKILADASRERVKAYKSYTRRRRSTVSSRDSTAGGIFSTAEDILSTDETIAQKLNEEEMAKAAARKEQERIDFEKALELQKQLDEREETDNIDWSIVAEQVQERQSDTIKRYQTLKKKPVSVAQARKNMMIYLKNMVGYKMGYFKGMSYDKIRPMFKKEYNKIQTLFKKDTEVEKTNTKRVAEETLLQESFKKLRTAEASRSEPIQEQPTEEPKELSKEELKKMLEIVPVEEIKAEALQVKYPIINWEIHTEGSRKYWKIIRISNITYAYQVFEDMLKGFNREDLVTLWSLIKERFRSAEPTEDMERALWVKLKRLFEPDKDDVLWKLQKYMHDPLTWRLYDTRGVHHVSSTRGHDIYMLTEKDYLLSTIVMGLMLSRRLQVEEDSEMARDLVMKIFIEANKPRS